MAVTPCSKVKKAVMQHYLADFPSLCRSLAHVTPAVGETSQNNTVVKSMHFILAYAHYCTGDPLLNC